MGGAMKDAPRHHESDAGERAAEVSAAPVPFSSSRSSRQQRKMIVRIVRSIFDVIQPTDMPRS
jgi:hypothetical protein